MGEAYNPEVDILERLEALELEARRLATKRDTMPPGEEREVIESLLAETESEIERLKARLRR